MKIPKIKPIYHHFNKWECWRSGFYETKPPEGMTKEDARDEYRNFLSDCDLFAEWIVKVHHAWPFSTEQFLTNENINRVAWIGQSSMFLYSGIPSAFRGGFFLLTEDQQRRANLVAEKALVKWINEKKQQTRNSVASGRIRTFVARQRVFDWNTR